MRPPGPILEPGDLVLTRGKGWISKAIRFFTRGIGEPRTKVNHVGVITVGGALTTAVIVEAIAKVERNRLWMRYGPPDGDQVAIYRHRYLNEDGRREIVRKMESYVGRRYDWLSIVGHTLDYALLGVFLFRRFLRMKRYGQCVWCVTSSYHLGAGVTFGGPPAEMSPDHVWDSVNGHPVTWERVWPLGPLSLPG